MLLSRNLLSTAILLASASSHTALSWAATFSDWQIERIGLTDSEHTRADGYQSSSIVSSQYGFVTGSSSRYSGSKDLGSSAWLYQNNLTQRIGLTGAEHTRSDGQQWSGASRINRSGDAIGSSTRYSGNSNVGNSAWLFHDGITTRLGFTDSAHTNPVDGYQQSTANRLNDAGDVAGTSTRYSSQGGQNGQSAWFYQNGETHRIGLFNSEHTLNNGYQSSSVSGLNQAGQTIGSSARTIGQSAWFSQGGETQRIGLTDAQHTSSNGVQFSNATGLNEQGQAIGMSNRYAGNQWAGSSAWLYDSGVTERIGLIDSGHTRSDGLQDSNVASINNAGDVIGVSGAFNGSNSLGQDAWLYREGITTQIGLYDAEHTLSSGYHSSTARLLNESGQVAGYSNLASGTAFIGASAWLYSEGSTQRIGLTDTKHTRNDGFQDAQLTQLNQAGQVTGYNYRFKGNASTGISAWFYDDGLNQTFDLTLSERSDGYAYSLTTYLGDDGLVLGNYKHYAAGDVETMRPFLFSITEGLWDLEAFVEQATTDFLASNGWDQLIYSQLSSWTHDGSLFIAGAGQIGANQAAYVMKGQIAQVAPVPLPAAAWMFISALGAMAVIARRRGRAA